jgi:Flp pilus assembly protein TadG
MESIRVMDASTFIDGAVSEDASPRAISQSWAAVDRKRGFAHRDSRSRRVEGKRRRGTATVEFVLVAPLFFVLIFTILETGRMMMVQQLLTNAARAGARRGILKQTTTAEAETFIVDYLADTGVSGTTVDVTPSPLTQVGFGMPVTVNVSVPFANVSWLPMPQFLAGVNLSAQCVMRGERFE